MICRSDGADRNFNRGSYKDLAPEHSLALGDVHSWALAALRGSKRCSASRLVPRSNRSRLLNPTDTQGGGFAEPWVPILKTRSSEGAKERFERRD